MTEFEDFSPEIEDLLRQNAPVLPPTLKSRTLTNCASRAHAQQQRQHRINRQLTWAVAGVLAIQSLTCFLLDAQNTRLIAGNSPPRPFPAVSYAQLTEILHQRSRQIAQITESSKIG